MTNTANARQSADQVMAAYIVDFSYQPFDISACASKRNAAVLKLLWFRLIRPLLVLLTWAVPGGAQLILDGRNATPVLLDEDPDDVVSIRKNLLATVPDPGSIMEIAAYAKLDRHLLSTWQNDRSLVAYHDEHGHFRSAVIRA